ncbi:MAG TPA: FGGY-family carbohydrate kinase, partial [Gammaproteobacteria bacterium]|nr:FGGY-family carbohydrate kinase [Gammaproteobacteria bacterium]
PLAPALMYNDSRGVDEASRIARYAPTESAAQGASSGLAKLLYLQSQQPQARHALHQADWIAGKLCHRFDASDANNALKTGYDVINNEWPSWLDKLGVNRSILPQVYPPGRCIGTINKHWSAHFKLPASTRIMAGTTDSIAAFIATGASLPGEAVTSLGSTLVLKIISERPIFAPQFGIYSHRLGNLWLAGGASNSGGAVLRQFFTDEQMHTMTPLLTPEQPTELGYYPLPATGERFPINDAALQPRLSPRPANDALFFQGMLEAMARIEHDGYKKLHQLGAPALRHVKTAGGGSCNPAWTKIRQQELGVEVVTANHTEACYGSALLAQQEYNAQRANVKKQ